MMNTSRNSDSQKAIVFIDMVGSTVAKKFVGGDQAYLARILYPRLSFVQNAHPDFAGTVGTPIYAPAAGKVIYSDTLQIRGNTLIIDHGLGVMSGYYHLSAVHVDVGQEVEQGQLIADGGSTGLSTGPHLHWDLRVLNAAVDGLQWVESDLLRSIPR